MKARAGRIFYILLAVLLIVTGLRPEQGRGVPVLGQERVVTGVTALLPAAALPNRDLFLQEEEHNLVRPVQRTKCASGLRTVHSADQAALNAGVPQSAVSFGPAWYATDGAVFFAPSWQAIVSLIHRTRRKSR